MATDADYPSPPIVNSIGCPNGLPCNNGTTNSPILPPLIPKPKDPKHPDGLGNPCAENQCWSDCDCAPGLTPADRFVAPKHGLAQVPSSTDDFKDPKDGRAKQPSSTDDSKNPKDGSAKRPPFESITGIPCAEGQCHSDCDCRPGMTPTDGFKNPKDGHSFENLHIPSSSKATSFPTCPEGQCFPDCECSVDSLLAFINPGTPLASMPRVCASGECSANCICRDDLVKTARVVAELRKHYGGYVYHRFSCLASLILI
jgi:hypothetical protein